MTAMAKTSYWNVNKENNVKRDRFVVNRTIIYVLVVIFMVFFVLSSTYILSLIEKSTRSITMTTDVHDVTAIILNKKDFYGPNNNNIKNKKISELNEEENEKKKLSTVTTTTIAAVNMLNLDIIRYQNNNTIKFNNVLLDCRKDSYCHLLYHHVPKTAGTLLAGLLHRVFDEDGKPYVSSDWCCYEVFMDGKFNNNPREYCAKRRISILELWGKEFERVMEVCNQKDAPWNQKQQQQHQPHRYIALVSTREPIERTISLINYQCNGDGYENMSQNLTWQSHCRNCSYVPGTTSEIFFDYFVNDTIKTYNGIAKYISLESSTDTMSSTTNATKEIQAVINEASKKRRENKQKRYINNKQIPVLLLDTTMINNWIRSFDVALNKRIDLHPKITTNWYEAIKVYEKNKKNVTMCNFQKTHHIIDKLSPAVFSYYNVVWNNTIL